MSKLLNYILNADHLIVTFKLDLVWVNLSLEGRVQLRERIEGFVKELETEYGRDARED